MAWREGERRACSACGVECIGAKSRHGSVGPIELEPRPTGNVLLFKGQKGELRYAVLPGGTPGTPAGEKAKAVREWVADNFMTVRTNHFATCPEREKFGRNATTKGQDGDST